MFVGEIIVSLPLERIKRKLLVLTFHIMQSSVSATKDPLLQRELCTQKGKEKKFWHSKGNRHRYATLRAPSVWSTGVRECLCLTVYRPEAG